MKTLGIGVIGLGQMGERHAKVYSELPQCTLVAVASKSESRAREIASAYGASRWYTDFNKLVTDPEVQAVSVTTIENEHKEPAIAAAEAGRHILVEKPIATALRDADIMIQAARRANVIMMPGHILRFDVAYAKIKQMIDDGKLGKVVYAYGRRSGRRSRTTSRYSIVQGITPNLRTAIHEIDLILWYVNDEVETVYARALKNSTQELQTVEGVVDVITFKKEAIGCVESVLILPDTFPGLLDVQMEVIGTKGAANINPAGGPLAVCDQKQFTWHETTYWPTLHGNTVGCIKRELEHFVSCVQNNEKPIVDAEDARTALEIVLAGDLSCKLGKPIRLPLRENRE